MSVRSPKMCLNEFEKDCGTKEMDQPCPVHLHVISLVALT